MLERSVVRIQAMFMSKTVQDSYRRMKLGKKTHIKIMLAFFSFLNLSTTAHEEDRKVVVLGEKYSA